VSEPKGECAKTHILPFEFIKPEKMENDKIRNVIMAAMRISEKHNRRELIKHEEWKELEESLRELKRISGKEERTIGFHSR